MAIDCVLCFRDENGRFFINAYVTLLSVFENTRERLRVHILHDETVHHGRAQLEALCASYGHEVLFHPVPQLDAEAARRLTSRFNIGTTYRYYVHEFVQADKAVYLDCDVIVNRDIADLYNFDIGPHYFAGVSDDCPYWKNGTIRSKYAKVVEHLHLSQSTYVNAGVLLMNLGALRALSEKSNVFLDITFKALQEDIHLEYLDQDVFNSVAAGMPGEGSGGVLMLDKSFNLWGPGLGKSLPELANTIVHFITKPDAAFLPAHLLFWKYYAMTPFADDMFERMSAAYSAKSMDIMRAYIKNTSRRRQAVEFLRHGPHGMVARAVMRKFGAKG